MTARITRRSLLAAPGLLLDPRFARAAFPERPLRIVVGFAAGGTVDTIARILANALGPILGQQVIVENRPGGSASIAATQVVLAEPDGHTLLFGVFSHAVAPALAKLAYDTAKDLTAVTVRFPKQWTIDPKTSLIRVVIRDRYTGHYGTLDVPVGALR